MQKADARSGKTRTYITERHDIAQQKIRKTCNRKDSAKNAVIISFYIQNAAEIL